ncbi:MAG: FAD-dependent oxidoreductase [Deltaproteobacteria bacterium]|nr:FAD-dependent oxidoreductase [Deltaproteobacteria bacterium]
MGEKRIVIIGMGTASAGASAAVNHTSPGAEVSIIEKRGYEMYSACGMPFAFEGRLKFDSLKHEFPARGPRTNLYLDTKAVHIDTDKKEVGIEDRDGPSTLPYDALIIATGAKPVVPSIANLDDYLGEYAYTLYTWEDVLQLYQAKDRHRRVTVIGGGAVGVEFAYAMRNQGLEVMIVEMLDQVFPGALDRDMARHVQEYLDARGITVFTNSTVEEVQGGNKLEGITIGEQAYETDLAILACGTVPNAEWIRDFGISCNSNGIITTKAMLTNVEGVYAAGDCVETFHAITGKRCRSMLAVPAMNQGRVAGINAAGGMAAYGGTMNTSISVLGEYAVGSTGLTAEQARQQGFELVMQKAKGLNKPSWYPGREELIVKLIADKKGMLLGGQVFGEKRAVKNRLDIVSAYLSAKGTLADMIRGELAYCPDIADIPDPLTTALDFMLRRVKVT